MSRDRPRPAPITLIAHTARAAPSTPGTGVGNGHPPRTPPGGHPRSTPTKQQTARLKRCERETGRPTREGYTVDAYMSVNFTPPATYVPSSPELEDAGSAQLRLSSDVLAIWLPDDYEHAVAWLDHLADEASSLAARIRVAQRDAALLAAATPTGGA